MVSPNKRRLVKKLFSEIEDVARLDRIESKIDSIRSLLIAAQKKDVYSTGEAAFTLKRTKKTIERLCREGRLQGHRTTGGRGGMQEWRVAHDEIERFRREGPRTSSQDDLAEAQ